MQNFLEPRICGFKTNGVNQTAQICLEALLYEANRHLSIFPLVG
jgi:hypothetical protein